MLSLLLTPDETSNIFERWDPNSCTTHPRWDFCAQSRRPRRSQGRHNRFHTPRHSKVESALISSRSGGFRNSLRTHNLCHKRARLYLSMMIYWNVRERVLYQHWSRMIWHCSNFCCGGATYILVLRANYIFVVEQIIFLCFHQMKPLPAVVCGIAGCLH